MSRPGGGGRDHGPRRPGDVGAARGSAGRPAGGRRGGGQPGGGRDDDRRRGSRSAGAARRPPRQVPIAPDPAREAAYAVLRAVDADGAYANLVLPGLLAERGVVGRDAAFATELAYGTLRALGTLDLVLARCVDRPLTEVDPPVRDLLRLGAYQALRTRVPPHAAVASVVDLGRLVGQGRAGGFVNAVLRRVTARDWPAWTDDLAAGLDPVAALAIRTAHPRWIAEAFADALDEDPAGPLTDTAAALAADDERPSTHLVAWPGRSTREELLTAAPGAAPGPWSPCAVRLAGGDPAGIAAVRERRAGVQDEGSQLCALALADAPLSGRDERWLDLCAGPGGKAALLAALAVARGARLHANERRPHRADLVRQAVVSWDVEVSVGDARELPHIDGGYDRVLLDAPCTGLGALRRRPEARWRRTTEDLADLVALQRSLLEVALGLVRPGGLVGYVVCSPHTAETLDAVDPYSGLLVDARPSFPGVPELGAGPTVQLWPHRQGTDAMFFALLCRD